MYKKRIISLLSAAAIAVTMCAAPIQENTGTLFSSLSVSAASTVKVTLNANGGTCTIPSKTVTVGSTYGTLPTPTRSGYAFLGWYGPAGDKVTSTTVCRIGAAHTLTARWQRTSCTLKFNGNGGNVSSTSKTYKAGKIVGTLPVARKDGYTFKGWYTKKTGGTRITYNTILKQVQDRTFYAQYAVPSLATLKYSFDNSYDTYGYDYDIPYSIYKYMLGPVQGREYYDAFKGYWGGNCFGMSSTSAFMNVGKVKVQTFNKEKYFIKDLALDDYSSTLGMNVCQFIECMQVSQYTARLQELYYETENNYQALVNRVKRCQRGTGKPLVVSVLNEDNLGHAIVAYKWKKISDYEDRIYVYDCNWPDQTSYITLYKYNGVYTDFDFDLGGGYYIASYFGGSISYFEFDDLWKVWTNRANSGKYSTLSLSAQNADIYTAAGYCCAKIVDGELVTNSDNIFEAKFADINYDGMMIYLPDGDYTVVNKDDETLEVSLCGNDAICRVTSDSPTVKLSPDETLIEIAAAEGDSYEVKVITEDGDYSESGCAESDGKIVVNEEQTDFIADEPAA